MNLPNIKYCGDFAKYIEAKDSKYECVSFYKPKEYFATSDAYTAYVKACEKTVRNAPDYKTFINYVKGVIGINFCQVSSQIFDTDATIEMHHGPLFTLWDYVSIILNSEVDQGHKITTFRIADKVLQEHFDLHVQVVMLAITNHEAVHNRDIFLNIKQGFGDVGAFIEKYKTYLTANQKYRIVKYLNLCESTDSFDNNLFDVEKITSVMNEVT